VAEKKDISVESAVLFLVWKLFTKKINALIKVIKPFWALLVTVAGRSCSRLNGCKKVFYIDTGAEVSVMPESTYKALKSPMLSKSKNVY